MICSVRPYWQQTGPLLLLAGAGSGKTTVLINRIANLIKYGCGADTDYVPDKVTEEDLAFLEAYVIKPSQEDSARGSISLRCGSG